MPPHYIITNQGMMACHIFFSRYFSFHPELLDHQNHWFNYMQGCSMAFTRTVEFSIITSSPPYMDFTFQKDRGMLRHDVCINYTWIEGYNCFDHIRIANTNHPVKLILSLECSKTGNHFVMWIKIHLVILYNLVASIAEYFTSNLLRWTRKYFETYNNPITEFGEYFVDTCMEVCCW